MKLPFSNKTTELLSKLKATMIPVVKQNSKFSFEKWLILFLTLKI